MARFSRRSLLAFGGLLMGGAPALAAPDEAKGSKGPAEARLKLAQDALEFVREVHGRGKFSAGERDPLSIWSRRRMEARLDLSSQKADRIAAAREHVDEMKAVEQIIEKMYGQGEIDKLAMLDAQYRRQEAESWLAREQDDPE